MGLEISAQDDVQLLRIFGELDAYEVQQLKQRLDGALQVPARLFAVDVSAISMVDSSGIGLLVSLFQQAKAKHLPLALIGLQGQPAEMLRFLRIDEILPSHPTLEAALASLNTP